MSQSRPRRRWIVVVLLVAVVVFVVAVVLLYMRFNRDCCMPLITTGAGEILFMSNRDGDWDIYLMALSDRTAQNLTDNDVDDGFGAFSEDGGAITFLSNREPEEGLTAYMMDADGTNVSRVRNDLPTILNVLSTGRMTWDLSYCCGGMVNFVSLRDLNLEVYLQTPNDNGGVSERNLSNNGAIDWFPATDGERIAFVSDRDGNQEIYVMNMDGTELRRLTDDPGDDLFPAWVIDGRQIIFYSERDTTLANGALALYVVDANSENAIPVRLDGGLMSLDGETPLAADRHYGQDRRQLDMAYDGSDWEIYVSDQVGRHAANLTDNDSDDIFPTWR